jgi:hypothetical protein
VGIKATPISGAHESGENEMTETWESDRQSGHGYSCLFVMALTVCNITVAFLVWNIMEFTLDVVMKLN